MSIHRVDYGELSTPGDNTGLRSIDMITMIHH